MFTTLAAELPAGAVSRTYLETDQGGHYYVMGTVPGQANTWFVRAERTQAWAVATLTSRTTAKAVVRVRFTMAVDTGDAAGTLAFSGESFGGKGWPSALARAGVLSHV